jgi:hypothetical protein
MIAGNRHQKHNSYVLPEAGVQAGGIMGQNKGTQKLGKLATYTQTKSPSKGF